MCSGVALTDICVELCLFFHCACFTGNFQPGIIKGQTELISLDSETWNFLLLLLTSIYLPFSSSINWKSSPYRLSILSQNA